MVCESFRYSCDVCSSEIKNGVKFYQMNIPHCDQLQNYKNMKKNLLSLWSICESCEIKYKRCFYTSIDCFAPKIHLQQCTMQNDQCNHKKCSCDNRLDVSAEAAVIINENSELLDLSMKKNASNTSDSDIQLQTTSNEPSTSAISPKSFKKIMKCEHCEKVFTHKGDLNKHLRSHTGEQPFECPVCKRRFAHTSNLARHLRVHSGDRPYRCEKCNKDFGRKDKLFLHQKSKMCTKVQSSSS